jgi:hypothetical protein
MKQDHFTTAHWSAHVAYILARIFTILQSYNKCADACMTLNTEYFLTGTTSSYSACIFWESEQEIDSCSDGHWVARRLVAEGLLPPGCQHLDGNYIFHHQGIFDWHGVYATVAFNSKCQWVLKLLKWQEDWLMCSVTWHSTAVHNKLPMTTIIL